MAYVFYSIYSLLFLLAFCVYTRRKYCHLSILPLLFFPHFNNLCLIKIGMTFSFFELYVFFLAVLILFTGYSFFSSYRQTATDKILLTFMLFSVISIVVAQIRIMTGNLSPSPGIREEPAARSIMSLNKLIVFLVMLPYIRTYFISRRVDIAKYFKIYLAWSALLPTIAVILQFAGIECRMFFNNPSFSDKAIWASPTRPFGLSYEASFYAIMCFLSFIGVYYVNRERLFNKWLCYLLFILYFVGVALCFSRTGLLILLLFVFIKNVGSYSLKKIVVLGLLVIVLVNVSVFGLSLVDRILSSFSINSDASTFERFGSMLGLLNLFWEKGLVLGVGIFNYTFYLYEYMPQAVISYMHFHKSSVIVSFNFILQLAAEWGFPLFVSFLYLCKKYLKPFCKDGFEKDWFIYLAILSLSVQMPNFSIAYIILLYLPSSLNQNVLKNAVFVKDRVLLSHPR